MAIEFVKTEGNLIYSTLQSTDGLVEVPEETLNEEFISDDGFIQLNENDSYNEDDEYDYETFEEIPKKRKNWN